LDSYNLRLQATATFSRSLYTNHLTFSYDPSSM
jgi:hypothetical protein